MPSISIWEKESFFEQQDIIITGSGFVGLWSALKLKELNPLAKITILERGLIPSGASTRNAGFSCFGSPSELLQDVAKMGEQKTFELVNLRYQGLMQIRQYFSQDTIQYDAAGGYECFTPASTDWQQCEEGLQWLNNRLQSITGLTDTFTIADDKLGQFGFNGFNHLIENKLEGGLHSGKTVQALLQKIQGMGVQVLTGITVTSFEKQNGLITLHTDKQLSFCCRQLLLCTNAFTRQLLPQTDIIPARGQVLVTGPIDGCKLKGTFHFDQGYYYFRNLGNRLLLGGARNKAFEAEETTVMETSQPVQDELERFARTHILPGIAFTITHRWSGIMAMGSEKLPIVKMIEPGIFCCVRMSGMGVALAPVVAGQVASLMQQAQ
ncbi:MAG: hypothetical protein RL172_1966 [Bacteroidota bacterium]